MNRVPVEKRFAILCGITRAQHFAWREAVRRMFPDADASRVVDAMWEISGKATAEAYARQIDRAGSLAAQVAERIAESSRCMGEDALAEVSGDAPEAYVRHKACPWLAWHARSGLLAEDRAGCDRWFESTVENLNRILGTRLRVETLEALPSGGASCLRRIWVEEETGCRDD